MLHDIEIAIQSLCAKHIIRAATQQSASVIMLGSDACPSISTVQEVILHRGRLHIFEAYPGRWAIEKLIGGVRLWPHGLSDKPFVDIVNGETVVSVPYSELWEIEEADVGLICVDTREQNLYDLPSVLRMMRSELPVIMLNHGTHDNRLSEFGYVTRTLFDDIPIAYAIPAYDSREKSLALSSSDLNALCHSAGILAKFTDGLAPK